MTLYILMKNDYPMAASYCEKWLQEYIDSLEKNGEMSRFHIKEIPQVCDSKSQFETLVENGFYF